MKIVPRRICFIELAFPRIFHFILHSSDTKLSLDAFTAEEGEHWDEDHILWWFHLLSKFEEHKNKLIIQKKSWNTPKMLRNAFRVISKSSHRTRDLPPVCFTPGSSLLSACQWDINPPPVSFNNLFLGLQQIPMSLKWAPTKYLAACFAINPQWSNREQIGWQQQQQQQQGKRA